MPLGGGTYTCPSQARIICPGPDVCNNYTCTADPSDASALGICTPQSILTCSDDGDQCTNEYCDASQGGCVSSNITCGAHSVCNPRRCDSTTGNCIDDFIKCDDGLFCTNDTCDVTVAGGCVYTPIICPNPVDDCHIIDACNETLGACVYTTVPSLYDFCGTCRGDNIACFFSDVTNNAAAAGIAGGIAAAIAIAAVFALLLGIFGSKKGYDFYQARSDANSAGLNSNPMYEKNSNAARAPSGVFDDV